MSSVMGITKMAYLYFGERC